MHALEDCVVARSVLIRVRHRPSLLYVVSLPTRHNACPNKSLPSTIPVASMRGGGGIPDWYSQSDHAPESWSLSLHAPESYSVSPSALGCACGGQACVALHVVFRRRGASHAPLLVSSSLDHAPLLGCLSRLRRWPSSGTVWERIHGGGKLRA